MGEAKNGWANVVGQAASTTLGTAMGLIWAKKNDQRQLAQQKKLNDLQMVSDKEMLDYQKMKELEMWNATSYGAQMANIKEAGLNPAMLYGMGGGGGQSTGGSSAHVGAASAPGGGNEIAQALGMGLQMKAQTALLQAQKENIEADTELKKEQAPATRAGAEGTNLDNALKSLLRGVDENGNDVTTGEHNSGADSIAAKREAAELKFRMDENQRQEIMNNKQIKEIGARIELMAKQGMKEGEITENLKKEGKLLDVELAFSDIGLTRQDPGKFLMALVTRMLTKSK